MAAPPLGDSSASVQAPESGSEPTTALGWFDRGIELAAAEDYAAAAAAFLRSNEIQPTGNALLNAAYAFEAAGQPLEAVQAYQAYLAQDDIDPPRVAEAQAAIEALLPKLATLRLRFDSEHPPTRLLINGVEHDVEDFPLLVLPGVFEIEAVNAHGAGSERLELYAGESLAIDVRTLLPEPDPEPDPDEDTGEDDPPIEGPVVDDRSKLKQLTRREHNLRTATWVGLGLTGATGVAVLVTGLLTQRDLRRLVAVTCFDTGTCDMQLGDPGPYAQAFQRHKLATNVLWGVGAGLAVMTTVLGLSALGVGRQRKREAARVQLGSGLVLRF